MGLLESLFGLGQPDIREVFIATIRNAAKLKNMTSERRDGVALAVSLMLDELLRRDVASNETHTALMGALRLWHTSNVIP